MKITLIVEHEGKHLATDIPEEKLGTGELDELAIVMRAALSKDTEAVQSGEIAEVDLKALFEYGAFPVVSGVEQ